MIETYWNEVFGDFKESNGKFNIPGLPEPLMSAHFGVKNIIGSEVPDAKLTLKLCSFLPLLKTVITDVGHESLREARTSEAFWKFHQEYNKECEFLKKLILLLETLKTPHIHFFLGDSEGIVASAIVGVTKGICFSFNLVVRPDQRGSGRANLITETIRSTFPDKRLFYWTTHPWFTSGGEVMSYHILS